MAGEGSRAFALAQCAGLIAHGAPVKPDADISGIGVLLAFILSAYLTFGAVLAAYLGGLVDDELLSPVDRRVFGIRAYAPPARRRETRALIRSAVMLLSDQQIVTGIAIMGAGFQGLRTGTISVYHFQIVLYLAWMSSSVHLTAITLLAPFLKKHRGVMVWRLVGMLVLFVMLLVGMVPTISNDWGIFSWQDMEGNNSGWGIPAKCFWGSLWGDGVGPDAPLGFVILIFSYAWKMGQMFRPSKRAYYSWFRRPVERLLTRVLKYTATRAGENQARAWLWLLCFRLFLGLALPSFVLLECFSSFAASLRVSLTGLVFGTVQVAVPRQQLSPLTGSEENTWGFGQLVPLVLLVQPLGSVLEHVWNQQEENEHRTEKAKPLPTPAPVSPGLSVAPEEQTSDRVGSLRGILVDPRFRWLASEDDERDAVRALLFSSNLFASLVWLVQAAIVTICTVVFYFDALTIGNQRSDNWQFILQSIAAATVFGFLATVVTSPWSRIGRAAP